MAQLVEQRIRNAWVGSSSLPIGNFDVCFWFWRGDENSHKSADLSEFEREGAECGGRLRKKSFFGSKLRRHVQRDRVREREGAECGGRL